MGDQLGASPYTLHRTIALAHTLAHALPRPDAPPAAPRPHQVQQANAAARAGGGVAPYTFVLNVVIPSSAHMSMVVYFQPRRAEDMLGDRPEAKLLRAFIAGDTAYRNERFKLLARPRGSALLRTLIGDKPALIGRKLAMPYFSGPNHFEVCVDVTSNTFAEYVTRVARDAVATNMSLDLGFTIEGRCEEVLPYPAAPYPASSCRALARYYPF